MAQTPRRKPRRLREPGLLATESRKKFLRLRQEFYDDINPCCATERMYVDWIASLTWEILRLFRIKAELISSARFDALEKLLKQVLPYQEVYQFGSTSYKPDPRAEELARRWFVDDTAKRKVAALLARLGFDEGTVEMEAYRMRDEDIDALDTMIATKMKIREDALLFIGKLRKSLGDRLRHGSAGLLQENQPPILIARIAKNGD